MTEVVNIHLRFNRIRRGGNVSEGSLAVSFQIFSFKKKNTKMSDQCKTVCSVTFSSFRGNELLKFDVMFLTL